MMKRMVVMLIIVLVLFGGLFGLKSMANKGMQAFFDNMPQPPVAVTTAVAEAMAWPREISAVGSISPVNGIDVTTEVGGLVQRIEFESGAHAEAGQLLVQLDARSEQASLDNLRAQARLTATTLKRVERLHSQKTLSKSDLDEAQANHDSALAQVAAQEALIAKKSIRAPFAGELGIRKINLGQYLDPGTAVVPLQSLDPVYVDFSLPERELSRVAVGYAVSVEVDAYDHAFTGEVLAIEPQVNEKTRNFRVRAKVPNPDHELRAGGFAQVALRLPGDNEVIAVPGSAIAYSPYGNKVFVVQDGEGGAKVVSERFVKLGAARGDFIAVSEGLSVGDEVAATGLFRLRNQSAVAIDNSVGLNPQLNPTPTDR